MPITRKEFERGIQNRIGEWMKKIHAFLSKHRDEAFSATELKEQLHPPPRGITQDVDFMRQLDQRAIYSAEDRAIDLAIEKLAQYRAIEERLISGVSYYLYRGPLDDTTTNFPF